MPPIDLTVCNLDERGNGVVQLNGSRIDVKQLAIVAGAGQPTEVTLVLTNVRVNYSQPLTAPAARATRPFEDDELRQPGDIFKLLCHGCGDLFTPGDGHNCNTEASA